MDPARLDPAQRSRDLERVQRETFDLVVIGGGVVGAGTATIVFTVPSDAPDLLYYQCSAHSGMLGQFVIKNGDAFTVSNSGNDHYVIEGVDEMGTVVHRHSDRHYRIGDGEDVELLAPEKE